MSTPPLALEQEYENNKKIIYKSSELFDFLIDDEKIILKLSYNKEMLSFEIIDNNSISLKEFCLSQTFEELKKIDKYFILFDNIEDIYNSIRRLVAEKNLEIIKKDNEIKIKIKNSITNKYFYINIPKIEKNINNKIDCLFNYILSLNKKVNDLENQVKNTNIENNLLKQNLKLYEKQNEEINKKIEILQNQINELKSVKKKVNTKNNLFQNNIFENSSIIKEDDVNLILSWFDEKPKNFKLLLDSKIDGDLNSTFYEKCKNKYPTIVFVKTTKNLRFGGFTSVSWPEHNEKKDDKSFIFSLDKKMKYNIKKYQNATYYFNNISFCFGSGCDLFILDKCTSKKDNQVGNGSYDLPSKFELNDGEQYFQVSSYEVYQIEYK